jgi:hypothetical protein
LLVSVLKLPEDRGHRQHAKFGLSSFCLKPPSQLLLQLSCSGRGAVLAIPQLKYLMNSLLVTYEFRIVSTGSH